MFDVELVSSDCESLGWFRVEEVNTSRGSRWRLVMEGQIVKPGSLVLAPEDVASFLSSLERIESGVSDLAAGFQTLLASKPDTPAESHEDTPAETRVWDTSDEALSEYDAAQLAALRADHRADNHDAGGCHVCSVLERRLGTL